MHGSLGLVRTVYAAEALQQRIVEALHAQAQSVHARMKPYIELLRRQRTGVGLQRDLRVPRDEHDRTKPVQLHRDVLRRNQRRRAAPEKDAAHLVCAQRVRPRRRFAAERFKIIVPLPFPARKGRKIAIGALANAEGHMHIDCQRSHQSIFNTAMNASLGTDTVPT